MVWIHLQSAGTKCRGLSKGIDMLPNDSMRTDTHFSLSTAILTDMSDANTTNGKESQASSGDATSDPEDVE